MKRNPNDYRADVCWQYKIKQETLQDDLDRLGEDFCCGAKIKNFTFRYIPKWDIAWCNLVRDFIERYEWLGKMPVWVTHRFVAIYREQIVAAVVMTTPNAFSNLLGKESKHLEKLISRGATASYAPKNVASWIIMRSIKWMVKNTDFRLFTAYADPMAKELGTIYQACNFYYLGQKYGGGYMYHFPGAGWVGSSYFSQRATIKRIAVRSGIDWKENYIKSNKSGSKRIIAWENIPPHIVQQIKEEVNYVKKSCAKVKSAPKHKYAYVLGATKAETLRLRKDFESRNESIIEKYPKER